MLWLHNPLRCVPQCMIETSSASCSEILGYPQIVWPSHNVWRIFGKCLEIFGKSSLVCLCEFDSSIRSDEGLTLETSASESLYGGQFTLSTQLMKPNYPKREQWLFPCLPVHQDRTRLRLGL